MSKKNLLMEKPTPTCLVQWKSEGFSEIPIILGDVRVYINKKEFYENIKLVFYQLCFKMIDK